MPRATLLPGKKVCSYSWGNFVYHNQLKDITGKPGDMLDIYDSSGQLITQARYQPLSKETLWKMEHVRHLLVDDDWEWFDFYHDPGSDLYYVERGWPCGVDLSDDASSGGWLIPKEEVMEEPTDDYFNKLRQYCPQENIG